MSNFPKEQTAFLQAVYDMREAQKAFFRMKNDHRLRVAMAKEKVVDELLKPYITAGAINTATSISQQQTFL
jgi:hypothetical protein